MANAVVAAGRHHMSRGVRGWALELLKTEQSFLESYVWLSLPLWVS